MDPESIISSAFYVNLPANMVHLRTAKTAMVAIRMGFLQRTIGTKVTVNTILEGTTYSVGGVVFEQTANAQKYRRTKSASSRMSQSVSLIGSFIAPSEIATNGSSFYADGAA